MHLMGMAGGRDQSTNLGGSDSLRNCPYVRPCLLAHSRVSLFLPQPAPARRLLKRSRRKKRRTVFEAIANPELPLPPLGIPPSARAGGYPEEYFCAICKSRPAGTGFAHSRCARIRYFKVFCNMTRAYAFRLGQARTVHVREVRGKGAGGRATKGGCGMQLPWVVRFNWP